MLYCKNRRIVALILVALLCAVMSGIAVAEQESASLDLTLGCGVALQIPGEYAENFAHSQKVHFTPVTEVFSVRVGDEEIPLYRIDFGNEAVGEWLGVIQTEEGDIPVTYTLYSLSEEKIAAMDAEDLDAYYAGMENFNLVMDAIHADPRFAAQAASGVGENRELALEHWTLMLPEKITCEETSDGGVYTAAFYGRIRGEKTGLYTVTIGGDAANAVGAYEDKPLSVEIHEPGLNVFWTEVDYETAYQMLETVNTVMDAITADENFN